MREDNKVFNESELVLNLAKETEKGKHTEEDYVQICKQSQLIMNSVAEGILGLDLKGNHTFFNQSAIDMLGFSHDEFVNRHSHNLWHHTKSNGNSFPEEECSIYTTIRDGKKHRISDEVFWRKDGTNFPVEYTSSPIYEHGQVIGAVVTFLDITERRLTELTLQESEEKFRLIMENSPDAIFMVNPEGQYIYTNKAVTLLLGYSSEEMINKSLADISPPNKIEEYFGMFNKILVEGSIFTELELLKSDGNYISTDLNAVLLPDGITYASCRDISKRKILEQSLKESEKKLIQLNADKNRFIAILGHDLKGTFNNLLGLSEVLIEDFGKLDINEIKVLANQINSTAQNTSKLLEDLLVWARTQQGSISFKPQPLNLRDTCLNILEVLEQNAKAKNIKINYSVPENLTIIADIDKLKTILRNLISNAIKFTDIGGTININAEVNPERARISVSDTGIGIADDILTKLFDISQFITTNGTSNEKGTGLGLLICKEFVENHGGEIWVESVFGDGSSFYFTLPHHAD